MSLTIDVHGHIFNALDIPLKGYLLSRKYDKWYEKVFTPVLIPLLTSCLRKNLLKDGPGGWDDSLFGKSVKFIVNTALGKGYKDWADTLCKRIEDINKEMVDTLRDQIDLFIPLVIDYEYWFLNTVDNKIDTQLTKVFEQIVSPSAGKIHPFVPFCPARELAYRSGMLNPDGNPETISSLDLVKKYIREKGFIGVKLYNSLGYKPLWNREVENQRRKIAYHKNYYRFSGHEYDAVLSELYQFCVEEEVPITAHCVMDGIEAYSQASWDFGQAKYWAEVLGQERFKNLKVNLAHFGWNSKYKWDHRKSWVEDICRMMNLYENLYADSAHHRVVIPSERKNFIRDYKEIFPQFPKVKERLLFGIDWHVIKRVENFINFKRDYITVLGESGLNSAEIDAFLGGNALKFLGLLPGGKNRNRLKDFYLYNHIEEPQWFKATI